MGISSISFTEIKSYCDLMGIEFTPKEVLTLKQMSDVYVSQSYDKDPLANAPYINKEAINVTNVDDSVRKAFDLF